MLLHPRGVLPLLRRRLHRFPITVVTGARQTGKTTLVRDLLPRLEKASSVYISLDDPDERLRLAADPVRRLNHGPRLVILDEVQKQPGLLDSVKLLADRRQGHRFLLLGSSQILLLRQVRETLAGRASLIDLWPLALGERVEGEEVPPCGLDLVWREGEVGLRKLAQPAPSVEDARLWRRQSEEHLRWGGYPGLEPLEEAERPTWVRDFRRTYLERDLADLGRVEDLDQFALAQNLFAARTGQLLSYSEVARELGVAVNTVKRYLRFLEISYQVFLLRPLLPTVGARLVKSPKLYWTDVGLTRVLAERPNLSDGPLFETYVCGELLRWQSWQADPPKLHFYRLHGGREVDFILHAASRLLAIESKAGDRAYVGDARPLADLLDARIPGVTKGSERLGIVVTRGREIQQLTSRVCAVPDWQLFGPRPTGPAGNRRSDE
jgi:predicted AAA+ superfamily ATPase